MRVFLAAIITTLLLGRAAGSPTGEAIPSASLGPYPFELLRTHIFSDSGRPAGKAEQLRTPFANDFPPSLAIGLETGREPDGAGRFLILSSNYLRVYNIRDAKTAPYETIQASIAGLEKVLKKRPKKASDAHPKLKKPGVVYELPDYPPRNAGHLIESKLSFIDAPWGSGICYITQFVQGMGETPNNEQLTYVCQGITKKQGFFISADFQISHPDVPSGTADPGFDWRKAGEQEAAEAFCEKIERLLDAAADESFTPPLRSLREWLLSLKLQE